MRKSNLALAVVAMTTLAGCSEAPTEGGWISVLGVMPPQGMRDQAVVVPSRARVGVPVSITVATVGSSNCTRPMGASVHVANLTASIYPFDLRYVAASTNCLEDAALHPRTATITFQEAGEATVTVVGINPDALDQQIAIERVIQVEP